MNPSAFDDLASRSQAAADTFLSVSNICLESAVRYTSLNLSLMRDIVAESTAAASRLAGMAAGGDGKPGALDPQMIRPLLDKMQAYSSDCNEIAAASQEQLMRVFKDGFPSTVATPSLTAFWSEAFNALQRGQQQLAATTAGSRQSAAARKAG